MRPSLALPSSPGNPMLRGRVRCRSLTMAPISATMAPLRMEVAMKIIDLMMWATIVLLVGLAFAGWVIFILLGRFGPKDRKDRW